MKKIDPLKYLERTDKWYLGGGNRLIWTPPFPVWLDYPGFWDKAHYYNYPIEPVFTWTVLTEDGEEIPLRAERRTWNPSKLKKRYEILARLRRVKDMRTSHISHPTSHISVEEEMCCLPNDVLASVVNIRNTSNKKRKLTFVAWTIQPSYPSKQTTWIEDVEVKNGTISFTKHLHRTNAPTLPLGCSFAINKKFESYSINLSEGSTIQPHWKLTPFAEKLRDGKLSNDMKLNGVSDDGLVFMALLTNVELGAVSGEKVGVFFSASPTKKESRKNISVAVKLKDAIKESEKNWNAYFSSVPYFACSDEYITKYYWYRWYGLRLNTIDVKEGNYKHPFVCEGIDYFRAPISYSAPCHMLENRWLRDPKLAQGSLLTFLDNQREDGGFRGYVDVNYYRQEMFYHAYWGMALRELHALHPDVKFLKRVYPGLKKYVEYFDSERDAEGSGLYDIDNHYETGQEYMHRYLAVDKNADKDNWGEVFRLKGVDVTVYIYELKKTLAWIASTLNLSKGEVEYLSNGVMEIKKSVLEKMWDKDEQMFFDVNPKTGKRTKVKAATCFYPYMTDIVDASHLVGFKFHLLNPKEFWTEFLVPSSSVDDTYFNAEAEWKGKRMNCPWNGRVWPMTNSHIAEALAQTAIRFNDDELKAKTVEFITKFVRMMFFNGDSTRPNCFEHYNPFTGQPSTYRGVDDYQHSWIVDLIFKYIVGLRDFENGVIPTPLSFHIRSFVLENIRIHGKKVKIRGERGSVLLDESD